MADLIYSVLPIPPRKIAYINPQESVKKCIDRMTELNIGALVVADANKQLIGIVSERDILRSCLYKGLDPKTTSVEDVANTEVSLLSTRDTVEKAMQVITETKRRHVLIKEGNELIAIVSIGDLLYHLLEDKARVIEQLENYIYR